MSKPPDFSGSGRGRSSPRPELSLGKTKIAAKRQARGWTQQQAADAAGLPIRTYQALERDEIFDPGVRQLTNVAQAFGCELREICEDKWLQTTDFTAPRRSRRSW
jgi:transcriptional regulator with XRE-family HTH domain